MSFLSNFTFCFFFLYKRKLRHIRTLDFSRVHPHISILLLLLSNILCSRRTQRQALVVAAYQGGFGRIFYWLDKGTAESFSPSYSRWLGSLMKLYCV